jgi:hypothetical protein
MSEELAHGPVGSWMPIWLARMPASPTRQHSSGWSSGLTRSSRSRREEGSGQVAIDGNGQLVGIGNFDAQAEQVFANHSPEALIEIEAVAVADDAVERTP